MQDFIVALSCARAVFALAESAGYHFSLLDIGGGFYGGHVIQDGLKFEDAAAALGPVIDEYFPENIEVISEPGKFFVDSSVTCFTRIIGRRVIEYDNREPSYMCKFKRWACP
jgi:ornithine decarboxylase